MYKKLTLEKLEEYLYGIPMEFEITTTNTGLTTIRIGDKVVVMMGPNGLKELDKAIRNKVNSLVYV